MSNETLWRTQKTMAQIFGVGVPAISVPCGFDSKNMPVGLQLIGDKFSEQRLLNTAYAYEKQIGGFDLSRALAHSADIPQKG